LTSGLPDAVSSGQPLLEPVTPSRSRLSAAISSATWLRKDRGHRLACFVAMVALAVLAGIGIGTGTAERVLPLIACWLPVVLLGVVVRRRLQTPTLSPVWIVVVVFALGGSLGLMLQGQLNGALGGGIVLSLTESDIIRTTWLYAAFCGSLAVGAAVAVLARSRPKPVPRFRLPTMNSRMRLACLVLSVLPVLVVVVGLGVQLISRIQYLVIMEGTSLIAVAIKMGLGAVAVCGYLYGLEHGVRRAFAAVIAVVYFALFFAMASRHMALVPIGFAVGLSAAQIGRKGRTRIVLVGLVAALLLLPIPLYLRDQPSHGLVPHLSYMSSFSYGLVDWRAMLNNLTIGFPVVGKTAFEVPHLPLRYIWIELNPLLGTMAGWYQIMPQTMLNTWTPYSALGELGNYGPLPVFLVGLGMGAVLAHLDRRVGVYLRQGRSLFSVAISGCAVLLAVTMLQYGLRISVRILLYTVLMDLATRFIFRRSLEGGASAGLNRPG